MDILYECNKCDAQLYNTCVTYIPQVTLKKPKKTYF